MKKRSLIILLFSILVGLVVIGVGTTYAWLTQEGNKEITNLKFVQVLLEACL